MVAAAGRRGGGRIDLMNGKKGAPNNKTKLPYGNPIIRRGGGGARWIREEEEKKQASFTLGIWAPYFGCTLHTVTTGFLHICKVPHEVMAMVV